ncbi:cation-dependent mannose-6-phosphate receptor [Acrasis kona]|uniref:Cation-dependent mannose-6-phosphate receptor n=1 Tax=Acrasis kona TaxID=1008807 RepID=A0AAW2YV12_9EUKA
MKVITLIVLALCLFSSVKCICGEYQAKNGTRYSFAPITLHSPTPNRQTLKATDDVTDNDYEVSICGHATDFKLYSKCTKKDAGAYQIIGESCYPVAGTGNNYKITEESSGLKLTADEYEDVGYYRTLVVVAICDEKAKEPKLKFVSEQETQSSHYEYTFELSTEYACAGRAGASKPIGELGVGGLIMILFLAAIALYFIIGALLLKFKFKKEGQEIIPNVEFWKDLPFLIKDGPMLFVDLIKKRKYSEIV